MLDMCGKGKDEMLFWNSPEVKESEQRSLFMGPWEIIWLSGC